MYACVCAHMCVNQYEEHCSALPKESMKQPRLTGLVFSLRQATLEGIRLNSGIQSTVEPT